MRRPRQRRRTEAAEEEARRFAEGASLELAELDWRRLLRIHETYRPTEDVDASDEVAARAEIDELCRRLLANPVIEDADISISPAQGSITTGGRTG